MLLADTVGSKLDYSDQSLKDWQRGPRRLLDGTIFPLGTTRGSVKSFNINRGPRGEDGYSLTRAARSLVLRDKSVAQYEWALSEKLAEAGFQPAFGGLMIPLSGGRDLYRTPGNEQDIGARRPCVEMEPIGLVPRS